MRFTSILVAGAVAAVAHAQSTATSTGSSTATTAPVSPVVECLDKCDPADTKCRAACVMVPSPNDDNVNQNTACAAACDQGNGSAEQNVAWGECVAKCASSFYFGSTGTPNPTGAAGSGSGNSAVTSVKPITSTVTSNGSTYVTTHLSTSTPSGSGAASSPTAPPNAAGMVTVSTGAGIFGVLAAIFAL